MPKTVYSQTIDIIGPLTYTDNGTVTIYGVVTGAGNGPIGECESTAVFGRVSSPNVLPWITETIKKYH